VVIGVAGGVCGGFMFKYFTSHTEVNWSKKNRMTHDNQGIGDVSAHNSHFGMRKANKHHQTYFPFAFEPMQGAQHTQTSTRSLAAVIAVSSSLSSHSRPPNSRPPKGGPRRPA
jgi:hypothetical protein